MAIITYSHPGYPPDTGLENSETVLAPSKAVHLLACDPTRSPILIVKREYTHNSYNCANDCPVRRYCSAASLLWPKCTVNQDHKNQVIRVGRPTKAEILEYVKKIALAVSSAGAGISPRDIIELLLGPAIVQLGVTNGVVSISSVAELDASVRILPQTAQGQRKLIFKDSSNADKTKQD